MTENESSAPLPEPALKRIREIVREFKAEGGYEFEAETAPEAFLQQEIKTLLEDLNEALSGVALPEPRLTLVEELYECLAMHHTPAYDLR